MNCLTSCHIIEHSMLALSQGVLYCAAMVVGCVSCNKPTHTTIWSCVSTTHPVTHIDIQQGVAPEEPGEAEEEHRQGQQHGRHHTERQRHQEHDQQHAVLRYRRYSTAGSTSSTSSDSTLVHAGQQDCLMRGAVTKLQSAVHTPQAWR